MQDDPPYDLEFQVFTTCNRLNKRTRFPLQYSTLNLQFYNWRISLQNGKKIGGEIKLTLQFKITTPEFEKWKLVFKAFISSIQMIQISSNLVILNAWFSVLFLSFHCKVSKTSYLIRLNSKLLKFEILALCFRD